MFWAVLANVLCNSGYFFLLRSSTSLEATLAMKEQALAEATPPSDRAARYHPGDRLLGFLNSCRDEKTMRCTNKNRTRLISSLFAALDAEAKEEQEE